MAPVELPPARATGLVRRELAGDQPRDTARRQGITPRVSSVRSMVKAALPDSVGHLPSPMTIGTRTEASVESKESKQEKWQSDNPAQYLKQLRSALRQARASDH